MSSGMMITTLVGAARRSCHKAISQHPVATISANIKKRWLSSVGETSSDAAAVADNSNEKPPPQPFVQTVIKAGEWDPETRTNPLYRPKYRSRAAIISAEDFANRPSVGFTGEFASFQDAMVTLSWLDQADQERIYQLYLDLMQHAASKHGKTSHEYVMRVIAQKYNITADRVAAVVQLQHNQEQMVQRGEKLYPEAADYMDNAIKNEINEAYQTFRLQKPDGFVEDPVGVAGTQESKSWRIVEDVFDADQMLADRLVREEDEARMIIDGHVYIEDIDEDSVPVPVNKDCKKLFSQKEKLSKQLADQQAEIAAKKAAKVQPEEISWRTSNGEGQARPRWKFVAQTVNTRELRKTHAGHGSYKNNSPVNTLVEENGSLREATIEEVKHVSWKPVRNVQEHTYSAAKKGWLNRTLRGETTAWGKAPPKREKPQPVKEEKKEVTDEVVKAASDVTEGEEKDVQDSNNMDSDSSSSDEDENAKEKDSGDSDSSSDEDEKDSEKGDEKGDKK